QMRNLENALQQLSADDARQALTNLAEQQRQLREQLDRSAEMLRRAALEGAMQTLGDEAKDIAGAEQALGDSLRGGPAPDTSAASRLASRSSSLSEDVRDLTEKLTQEGASIGADKTATAATEAAS